MTRRQKKKLLISGLVLLGAGSLLAVEVDRQVGSGLHEALAHMLHGGDINFYQGCALALLASGATLLILRFLPLRVTR